VEGDSRRGAEEEMVRENEEVREGVSEGVRARVAREWRRIRSMMSEGVRE
jgi:hypothetical protein